WALYGLPPLATPPELLPAADPWLGLAGEWIDAASPYGPLWELIALGAFHASGGSFLIQLFLLKLVAVLAYLGCIGFIYRTLTLLRPDWAIVGSIAFAWNPLVLFESVQNAHNDIVMVFFFVVAVWVFVRYHSPLPEGEGLGVREKTSQGIQPPRVGDGRLQVSELLLFCLMLAASVLIKFVTILAAPFFIIALTMRRPRWPERLQVFTLLSAVLAALIIIPMLFVWPGLEDWAVIQSAGGAGRSLLALLVLGLKDIIGTNPAFDLSRNVIVVIFGLIYLYQLGLMLKPAQSLERPIKATFVIFFWYVLLAAPVFHAWYLLWFLPAAVLLLPRQRPLAAAIVFSITALTIIPYFETVRVWYPFLLRNHFIGHLIGVPLLILPPTLTLLWPTGSTD
ncbi:MAG: hypothetical protein KDJ52_33785, partial [Anaerolineae bacterium]|nr:hypothetical protein [Anaerolineae bacterium]